MTNIRYKGVGNLGETLQKSIAPPMVLGGDSFVVLCDSDIAGAADNAKGLHSLRLTSYSMNELKTLFRYVIGDETYSYSDSDKIFDIKEFQDSGNWGDKMNENGFFDKNKYKLQFRVQRIDTSDNHEFCCTVEFFNSQAIHEITRRCENVNVGQKAILHPSLAMPGESVSVFCDADLARIPVEVSDLESIKLTWKSDESNETCLYAISRDPENDTVIKSTEGNLKAPKRDLKHS
ncbi:uncharacterized protein LOC131933426 [Physella acuta]|uniref:uncharacterized protein LOC131933426 n=1 Tax=Physella acuta TaxID=109671 RepID=UPI0027DADA13|nr:uncharacterized protein LOC131933426 [Physella acuta]